MNRTHPHEEPGPAVRRALARQRRGSKILVWFVVFLALLAGGQALILVPVLSELSKRGDPPAINDVNLPEQIVRVFASTGDLRLLLKSPLDLPEADLERARILDEALFPDGDRHRYFLLHAENPGEGSQELALPLVIEDADGKAWNSIDLHGRLRTRAEFLPDYLRFYLRIRVPAPGALRIPPSSARDILIAYPILLSMEKMARARVGGRTLEALELRKDELDGRLESTGRGNR